MSQSRYLQAMGIQRYRLRGITQAVPESIIPEEAALSPEPVQETPVIEVPASSAPAQPVAMASLPVNKPKAELSAASSIAGDPLNYAIPDDQGDEYQDDLAAYLGGVEVSDRQEHKLPELDTLNWPQLQERVSGCQLCELCKTRTNTVFGVGNPQADIMVIGEAPGADEDAAGEPFVGAAGQLLDNMLKAIGLDRNKVFIANILKCRPPANRNPHTQEIQHCKPYLERQIALIKPKLILSVGGVSAQNLLQSEDKVGQLRQQPRHLPGSGIPVHVTYHPAYLLRKPSEKAKSWQDLKRFLRAMQTV